jgi:hypothetical protein
MSSIFIGFTMRTVIVRDTSEFDKAKELQAKNLRFVLRLPQLTEKQNAGYQKQLNRHWSACGCQAGGVFFMSSCVLLLSGYLCSYFFSFSMGISFIQAILIIVVATIAGKMLGILHSRTKTARLLKTLKHQNLHSAYETTA